MPRAATLPLDEQPMDVRLMNGVASGVFVLAGAALLAAGVMWLVRAPQFTIRGVEIDGDMGRNSVNTIRANAMPRLRGNFFSLDLQQGRDAFEAVPWVRSAVVRRVWPDRLAVRLEEHRAAAVWQGEDGNDRLVNSFGEIFDANVGDVEDEGLPVFSGPDAEAAGVLAMFRRLGPLLAPLDAAVEELHLSHRGSWSVELDNGATLELGRGSEDEVIERAARFVRTLPEVTARWRAPLEYADLRHTDGYAVRLRGVTTKTIN
ncbi:cell division protein FtsQ [Rubrivivax gelatinosus]|uniref:cell division protein FtsQ/DivIB n=1 Tax=Rubrivivax gelatinosus TaxID=28068 RepID=UPI0019073F66|nr:cell division protein FtsQ/DivIB [Rubrivivax gelatinosus]MBK1614461.1 cell division protein FtsQ [Rubrivivax gelatinosus]